MTSLNKVLREEIAFGFTLERVVELIATDQVCTLQQFGTSPTYACGGKKGVRCCGWDKQGL